MKNFMILAISVVFLTGCQSISSSDAYSLASKRPTIQQSIDNAQSGDVVKIKPGTHSEVLILKDGVDLLFLNNSEVYGVTDNGAPVICTISGKGTINNPDGDGVMISNPGTDLTITLDLVTALAGSAIMVLGGQVTFTGDLWSDAGSGIWLEDGEATVHGNSTSNGSAGISVFQGGILNFYGNAKATEFGTHGAEVGMGGTLRAFDGTISTLRDSRNRSGLAIYGVSKAYLENVLLVKTNVAGYGIQGNFQADTVFCTNVTSNGGVAFEVVIVGDYIQF